MKIVHCKKKEIVTEIRAIYMWPPDAMDHIWLMCRVFRMSRLAVKLFGSQPSLIFDAAGRVLLLFMGKCWWDQLLHCGGDIFECLLAAHINTQHTQIKLTHPQAVKNTTYTRAVCFSISLFEWHTSVCVSVWGMPFVGKFYIYGKMLRALSIKWKDKQ